MLFRVMGTSRIPLNVPNGQLCMSLSLPTPPSLDILLLGSSGYYKGPFNLLFCPLEPHGMSLRPLPNGSPSAFYFSLYFIFQPFCLYMSEGWRKERRLGGQRCGVQTQLYHYLAGWP